MNAEPKASIWRRDVVGWSLYDFANTIYSMNIVSRYLKLYIVEDLGYEDYYFDLPLSFSMLIAALVLPALGALSDHGTKKKIFVFLFTLTCCSAVGLMAVVPASFIWGAIILFVIANFSYQAGQPFYNALLYSVAEGRQARLVSGVGVAWGYVGAVLGLILVEPFVSGTLMGQPVGFIEGFGKVGAFVPSAILFFGFSLPLFWWVKEKKVADLVPISFLQSYRDVWEGLRQTKKYPGVLRFLIADFFVEDAVSTVIFNIGIFCTAVLGLSGAEIDTFLIISTVTAVGGSFVIGYAARRWSLKMMLYAIIIGWVLVLVVFVTATSFPLIWILGSLVGILLGGIGTTTRPMLAELVPQEELGRFFGLFALSGRAAAVVGPVLWTSVVYLTQPNRFFGRIIGEWLSLDRAASLKLPYQAGVLFLAIMMLVGLAILRKVPNPQSSSHG